MDSEKGEVSKVERPETNTDATININKLENNDSSGGTMNKDLEDTKTEVLNSKKIYLENELINTADTFCDKLHNGESLDQECDKSISLSKGAETVNYKTNEVLTNVKLPICNDTESEDNQHETAGTVEIVEDKSIQSETEDKDEAANANSNSQNEIKCLSCHLEGTSDDLSDVDELKQTIAKEDLSDAEEIKPEVASADSEDSALGSLPSDVVLNENEGQDRSDGSDSGLGAEISEENKNTFIAVSEDFSSGNDQALSAIDSETATEKTISLPKRSNLKRKAEDNEEHEATQLKKQKKALCFDAITVYYFPRSQGFTCVPSQGGSTLGMEKEHTYIEKFTLNEHAQEQRRLHRQVLQQLRSDRFQGSLMSSSDDSETDDEPSDISDSEMDLDSYYFLQPVPTRQRRALLRAAGIRKIEGREKDECRDIRMSREFCGCHCRGDCKPETCSCSLAGIKCQVDRLNFPCGCTRESCKNTTGRIEFNPVRVRTHFIQTLMRIGMEKKNEEKLSPTKWDSIGNTSKNCMAICEPPASTSQQRYCDISHEVESCVNPGSYPPMHCEIREPQEPITNESNHYVYPETPQRMMDDRLHLSNVNNIHINPYTSNILQGKGPPYQPTLTYHSPFPSYNFSSENMLSYSASRFEEFAQPNMSMFSQYNMYNYLPKSAHGSNLGYNGYDLYKSNTIYEGVKQEYEMPQAVVFQGETKALMEGDQNWFSQNTLMNLDSNENNTVPCEQLKTELSNDVAQETTSSETSENLGEIIKKTIVDSV